MSDSILSAPRASYSRPPIRHSDADRSADHSNAPRLRRAAAALAGAALLAVSALGLASGSAAASPHHPHSATTRSKSVDPTTLRPPHVTVLKSTRHQADGFTFIGPKTLPGGGQAGPEIVDDQGRPVWFLPIADPDIVTDVRVQSYRGKPVLTYAVGRSTGGPGHSEGHDVILDRHYRQIATVDAVGPGLKADQHEFVLTPQGTALITIYHKVPYDLTSVGGPAKGHVLDGVVEEIDVATGKLLFEWHSLDHVPLSDSYLPAPRGAAEYDYFHPNSVNLDTDGNLLISARHTSTVYKIDHKTGEIIWRLGGKESTLAEGPGVKFAYQHNALPEGDNTVRIFDNESNGIRVQPHSRIIRVHIDPVAKTATLVSSIKHPAGLSAGSQGNSQLLPNGDTFVGWGQLGRFSELTPGGKVLFDAHLPTGYDSYRAYRSPWVGTPDTDPTAVARRTGAGRIGVQAIWNGATEVDRWVVLAGPGPKALHRVASTRWNGLNTKTSARTGASYVAVVALDDRGHKIGRSHAVKVSD